MDIKKTITWSIPGLGQAIRDAREAAIASSAAQGKELNVKILSDLVGISPAYWYDLEKEKVRSAASAEVLLKVEEVLEADLGVRRLIEGTYNICNDQKSAGQESLVTR